MIHFRNHTLLPIAAITTLGVSVKEADNPIGRFGTGLKYTIAGILRLGGSIEIIIDREHFSFASHEAIVRGKPFQIVHINDQPLGFTTDLGKHWEAWMHIRELWSNMKDEGGSCDSGAGTIEPGETLIRVDSPAHEEAFRDLDSIILSTAPEHTLSQVQCHRKRDNGFIYFRGIRCNTLHEDALFTYNVIGDGHLTEDRTLDPFYLRVALTNSLLTCENDDLIEQFLLAKEGSIEYSATNHIYQNSDSSLEFRVVVERLWREKPYALSKGVQQWAEHHFGLEASGQFREPTSVEHVKIERALAALERIGIECQFPRISKKPDELLYGYTNRKHIYLTERCLREGTSTIMATLLEEYLHLAEDLDDCSRTMQDRLLRMVVSLYEEHVSKEPL